MRRNPLRPLSSKGRKKSLREGDKKEQTVRYKILVSCALIPTLQLILIYILKQTESYWNHTTGALLTLLFLYSSGVCLLIEIYYVPKALFLMSGYIELRTLKNIFGAIIGAGFTIAVNFFWSSRICSDVQQVEGATCCAV